MRYRRYTFVIFHPAVIAACNALDDLTHPQNIDLLGWGHSTLTPPRMAYWITRLPDQRHANHTPTRSLGATPLSVLRQCILCQIFLSRSRGPRPQDPLTSSGLGEPGLIWPHLQILHRISGRAERGIRFTAQNGTAAKSESFEQSIANKKNS
ncbi:hypothetical protein KEM48_013659 [Puccinia striiformis f. sp. tritici PST-130]|nr:hypothetical protein KEM48_013659 [Puccinia striiformis f. sp. tritici PST-130]